LRWASACQGPVLLALGGIDELLPVPLLPLIVTGKYK
jgi:hypothetical protein